MSSAIVVGAGGFGGALAWWLARTGAAVTLVDQFEPGDRRATSGGESRLLRCAHGADAEYAASARRARTLWRELEEESGEALFEECGVAWFAQAADGWEADAERVLTELGIPVERTDPTQLFPAVAVDDVAFTLFEPEAGVLRAQRATQALARQAAAHGARLIRGRARPQGAAVVLGDGRVLEADHVVWACGGWLRDLFPDLAALRVTCQEIFLFDAGPEWAPPRVPGWVDYDRAMYGTSDLDGMGFKACHDEDGPPLDPDAELPGVSAAGEAAVRAYLAARFPALAGAPLRGARTCRYELSPDANFIAAPHPAHPSVWLLGGGSGHGFKHSPALAEQVAAALAGTAPLPARWAIGDRAPGRPLRTAGAAGR
jgi:glycine/D-amino acid oxidase-like deaminating enzyme